MDETTTNVLCLRGVYSSYIRFRIKPIRDHYWSPRDDHPPFHGFASCGRGLGGGGGRGVRGTRWLGIEENFRGSESARITSGSAGFLAVHASPVAMAFAELLGPCEPRRRPGSQAVQVSAVSQHIFGSDTYSVRQLEWERHEVQIVD